MSSAQRQRARRVPEPAFTGAPGSPGGTAFLTRASVRLEMPSRWATWAGSSHTGLVALGAGTPGERPIKASFQLDACTRRSTTPEGTSIGNGPSQPS